MILQVSFSNFYSFKNKAEVSFQFGKKPHQSFYDINLPDGRRVNKVIGAVGANGSGKTQMLKPLAFLSWFITSSFLSYRPDEKIPFKPHAESPKADSEFEVIFIMGGQEYKYKLVINDSCVMHESLYIKSSHLYSYIFVRDLVSDEETTTYDFKQKGFGFAKNQAVKIRKNACLIAAAYNYDVPLAKELVEYFGRIEFNISVTGRQHFNRHHLFKAAKFFHDNSEFYELLNQTMCGFDLGLTSLEMRKTISKISNDITNDSDDSVEEDVFIPFAIHKSEDSTFELPLFEESSGTQSAFVLLQRLLPVLRHGGLAVFDEIDNDLHPHLLPHILELFKFEETNPHNAQIIFSCHTPEILNLLSKHQIYLVEKINQESECWRLDEVSGLRADDNLYAKYMAGALSAIPDL
jgi:AAA15 family ATPase/GTPase